MDKDEALKRAREAFEWNYNTDLDNIPACEKWAKMLKENIATIKKVLAQPEQEPVAWLESEPRTKNWPLRDLFANTWSNAYSSRWHIGPKKPYAPQANRMTPLYTTPPQRKPLTDEQIFDLSEPFGAFQYGDAQGHKRLEFARAIEAAHGIKGEA